MRQSPLVALSVFFAGCVNDPGVPDGSMPDGTTPQDAADASSDAGMEASADGGAVYGDITDTSLWETFDMSGLTNNNTRYSGGAFDGKYVYYAPRDDSQGGRSGLFARFDTTKPFAQAASWEKFDLASKSAGLVGFTGAVFDGSYVYLTPYAGQPQTFVRYKTSQPFAMSASYETSDLLSLVGQNAKSFSTGLFDGKYVYITPCYFGLGVRFDSSAPMSASMSYASQTIGSGKICYTGSNFDGKYVYYIPQIDVMSNMTSGAVTRFDAQKSMTDGNAYVTFDAGGIDANAKGFLGSVFDGRYLYLIPYDGGAGGGSGSLVVRYDTQASFGDQSSWTKFDLANVSQGAHGYNGGTFDGRYIWFAPSKTSLAIRYDTQRAFGNMMSWQAFDLSSINVTLKTFFGAVFDGQYVYFVPYMGPRAVRFKAKTPPGLPPSPSSFY